MKPGDRGEPVRQLQQALVRDGFSLPRFGVDGDFGGETAAALRGYVDGNSLTWDGGDISLEILAALGIGDTSSLSRNGVTYYDLRELADNPHPKARRRAGKTVERNPVMITTIVLHQTGITFAQPKGTSGDFALARRALHVACHAMAFRRGFAVLAAPLPWHIYHADKANGRSLGLEVDGNYPGLIRGRVRSGVATLLTEETVAAARAGLELLVTEAWKVGMPVRYIEAHRQSDAWRRADPGEGLWRAVVVDYAVPVLGLKTRCGETEPHSKSPARNGLPVPREWDPTGVGSY